MKRFGGRPFRGRVDGHDKARGFYHVRYEDGDAEELEPHELERILPVRRSAAAFHTTF